MADDVATPVPAEGHEEAPLDADAIRSRVREFSMKWRRGREDAEAPAAGAEADVDECLNSMFEVADKAFDEWESAAAAIPCGHFAELDSYLDWLRTKVAVAEEMDRKAGDELAVLEETTNKDMIQLDAEIEELESLLWKLDSKDLSHDEANAIVELPDSTDLCKNQSMSDVDFKYAVLKLDQQIQKSEMEIKLLQNKERDDELWQLESMLLPFRANILDFKDNSLRLSLPAPIPTSDSGFVDQMMDCDIAPFVSDHEVLIELGEGIMEPKKVQIFPNDVCVDIEMLNSSREVISSTPLGCLIREIQHRVIVNALRRALVNDANSFRHSFEYSDKEETIIAHLVRGIDVVIKTSADWPMSSCGLKLISIQNSGTHPTNITSSLLGKAKEVANGLELQIRQNLVRFVDSIDEILVRELRSELAGHSSS